MKTRFYVLKFQPEKNRVFTLIESLGICDSLNEARKLIPSNFQVVPFSEMGKVGEHIMISNLEKPKDESDILEYYEQE